MRFYICGNGMYAVPAADGTSLSFRAYPFHARTFDQAEAERIVQVYRANAASKLALPVSVEPAAEVLAVLWYATTLYAEEYTMLEEQKDLTRHINALFFNGEDNPAFKAFRNIPASAFDGTTYVKTLVAILNGEAATDLPALPEEL